MKCAAPAGYLRYPHVHGELIVFVAEVLNTPDDWAAGRDAQLETAVQLALEALDKQPPAVPPDVSTGPGNARPPLPPRLTPSG
jgi:hypothetical protein